MVFGARCIDGVSTAACVQYLGWVAVQGVLPGETRFTCTACASTLILEFGTLSRLTGDQVYEQKAKDAMKCVFGETKCCACCVACQQSASMNICASCCHVSPADHKAAA